MKLLLSSLLALTASSAFAVDANRLTFLDDPSPYWPTPKSAKLVTPQWVGEPGVEAVVILAIDDLRDPAEPKYEAFLRPILDRLKRIDGRAPVSIMTNRVTPSDPQLAAWLKEGLSIESHTLTHPCPLLGKNTFEEASHNFHDSVDLLSSIPGNHPVAFRMPCCDSINSASPRFFSEIFNRPSSQGHWLAIDSSIFTLPPGERFRKYLPETMHPPMRLAFDRYAGFIEDYPYPYVVDRLCWEFPCSVPSDWEAFNAIGSKSPVMLEDWKAALDHVVQAQGVFTAVFHPHGWSAPEQWVDFIDYAQSTYGSKVKFLTFPEALARIEKNALAGHSLRAADGGDAGVRLLDVDGDGFMDVVIGAPGNALTRVWQPKEQRWIECPTPVAAQDASFGVVRENAASLFTKSSAWTWNGAEWGRDDALIAGLENVDPKGWRFRDFDGDGVCDLLANQDIFTWDAKAGRWKAADYALPPDCAVLDATGRDNGLRFVDLNGDGFDDVFQSNDTGYAIYLWAGTVKARLGWKRGWPHLVARGPAANGIARAKVLPFVKNGENYGGWFHEGRAVWQNEDTLHLDAYVLSRPFPELIAFDMPPPKSPQDSLATMRPRPGFTIELVASEPLIESPVAFEWDARGRLWVLEMPDYPLGMDNHGKPGGILKILTDSHGDGHYDCATTFLEGLPFPTGIMPWRNGVLIACAPDILFAADPEGDGKAAAPRALFTGFKQGNQQHRVNGFDWGLDGWIYGANGDSGGTINGVSISGRDFRFRPDTGDFEPESGSTQYGRRRDDWGNWFGNYNSAWLWHYTLEDAYLRRNPRLAVKSVKQTLANYPDSTKVFAVSEAPIRFNDPGALGHVTSGCSPCAYRDELFGPGFATSVFACEPVHNVVHREVLYPDGATFTSRRAYDEQDSEFLASTDEWFRPVMLKTGPDGALYVADFYRFVLEHPEWIAPETLSRLDVRAGADKGRIYRVLPTGAKLRPVPNLDKLDNTALAAALDSPSGWQRDVVQRVLYERDATNAVPELRSQAVAAENPKVRLQAVAALVTLQAIDPETVRAALRDPHPAVRVQSLRASESFGGDAEKILAETLTFQVRSGRTFSGAADEILLAVIACAQDPEFTVRYQCALSLGAFQDERAATALADMAKREGDHPQMRLAILSSLRPENPLFATLNTVKPGAIPAFVLPKLSTPDRAKVVAAYASVSDLKGDPIRGRELFTQTCGVCHRLKGVGNEVGPDLAMVADKPMDWLLIAIFDPNAAVEERYQAHTLKLKSGAELSGILSVETANNIVLRLPGGVDYPVLRSDIVSQQSNGRSLMPEGLESVLKPQDAADIISWLRAK
jgi:putative membrane-bound dehydrogenase-like protein